jgi:hypothetical protein
MTPGSSNGEYGPTAFVLTRADQSDAGDAHSSAADPMYLAVL